MTWLIYDVVILDVFKIVPTNYYEANDFNEN